MLLRSVSIEEGRCMQMLELLCAALWVHIRSRKTLPGARGRQARAQASCPGSGSARAEGANDCELLREATILCKRPEASWAVSAWPRAG